VLNGPTYVVWRATGLRAVGGPGTPVLW